MPEATRVPQATLVANVAKRRQRLRQKATSRPHKAIALREPAGAARSKRVPKRRAHPAGEEADEEWRAEVRATVQGFTEAHRATSTALEHDMYMKLINCYCVRMGHGSFVVPREEDGRVQFSPPTVSAARDERIPMAPGWRRRGGRVLAAGWLGGAKHGPLSPGSLLI